MLSHRCWNVEHFTPENLYHSHIMCTPPPLKLATEKITALSEEYRDVARRGSLLYFVITDLHKINSLYVYSLNAFVAIFQVTRGLLKVFPYISRVPPACAVIPSAVIPRCQLGSRVARTARGCHLDYRLHVRLVRRSKTKAEMVLTHRCLLPTRL